MTSSLISLAIAGWAITGWLACTATCSDVQTATAPDSKAWARQHNFSLAANAATAALDMWTTNRLTRTGKFVEANPMVLGTEDGHFGARAALVNGGIIAATAVAQKLVARRWPRARKWFTVINYSGAAIHGAAAARNLSIGVGGG
jgi:hypothetical protein